ncbi:MAG: permease [Elusimicrobia bacterium]|nr:permease [Elusimicrobiota bacterium]MBI2916032.1 permease [Elusimicrobiota bacterium]MBI3012731.1 permease [Elusimicrobiota bacterium]MBI4217969.1 permease [Elusimicrobiota bacterium]
MNGIGWIFGFIVLVLSWVAHRHDPSLMIVGWKQGMGLLLKIFPILILAFAISGLVQTLVPKEAIARWLGKESGWKGIWLGCLVGAMTPGGPYTSFPIVAALHQAGAGLGTLVAYVTAWSLWAVARLPIESALISPKFMVFRLLSSLLFPPLAGGIAHIFFSKYF